MIAEMHGSGRQAVLAITGGGAGAIAELLRVPGGSRLLLEALVPYDARSLASFLGFEPEQASSVETAVAMAQRARERAGKLAPTGAQLGGLGATAGRGAGRDKATTAPPSPSPPPPAPITARSSWPRAVATGRAKRIWSRKPSCCGWRAPAASRRCRRRPCSTTTSATARRSCRPAISSISSWLEASRG